MLSNNEAFQKAQRAYNAYGRCREVFDYFVQTVSGMDKRLLPELQLSNEGDSLTFQYIGVKAEIRFRVYVDADYLAKACIELRRPDEGRVERWEILEATEVDRQGQTTLPDGEGGQINLYVDTNCYQLFVNWVLKALQR